jgi:hypothetical protein
LRRAVQKYIENPMSEALIQGTFTQRPTFIEVYLENGLLSHRPVGEEKPSPSDPCYAPGNTRSDLRNRCLDLGLMQSKVVC